MQYRTTVRLIDRQTALPPGITPHSSIESAVCSHGLILAFAMTVWPNKLQGQTFDHVGLLFSEPVFSHGQLYVAMLHSRNRYNIKVLIKETDRQGHLLNDA